MGGIRGAEGFVGHEDGEEDGDGGAVEDAWVSIRHSILLYGSGTWETPCWTEGAMRD